MPWDPFGSKPDIVDRGLRPETEPRLLMRPRDARMSGTIFTRARGPGERLQESQSEGGAAGCWRPACDERNMFLVYTDRIYL